MPDKKPYEVKCEKAADAIRAVGHAENEVSAAVSALAGARHEYDLSKCCAEFFPAVAAAFVAVEKARAKYAAARAEAGKLCAAGGFTEKEDAPAKRAEGVRHGEGKKNDA